MQYRVVGLHTFDEQIQLLSPNAARTVNAKIDLLKDNPFRFKALVYKNNVLFCIRVADRRKDLRLIYTVIDDTVFLAGFLDRSKGYTDLEALLRRAFGKKPS